MNRFAFIGDVHGGAAELADVLARIDGDVERVIFLGDLVDKGPDSKGVLSLIRRFCDTSHRAISLVQGNHDRKFLEVLQDDDVDLSEFVRMGGASTIRSYVTPPFRNVGERLRASVPEPDRALLRAMKPQWESEGIIAVHDAKDVRGSDAFVVAGHALQSELLPTIEPRRALIDTGCGGVAGGRLTCFYWPSTDWFQSNLA